jgi:branched-subunit amino acid transport protein
LNSQWVAVIVTSVLCYAIKYAGHAIPEVWLAHPRVQRITNLIPIVLLSALVAMQALTTKTKFEVDHRLAGVTVAIVALNAKLPFPVVVVSAMATSAIVYRLKI